MRPWSVVRGPLPRTTDHGPRTTVVFDTRMCSHEPALPHPPTLPTPALGRDLAVRAPRLCRVAGTGRRHVRGPWSVVRGRRNHGPRTTDHGPRTKPRGPAPGRG